MRDLNIMYGVLNMKKVSVAGHLLDAVDEEALTPTDLVTVDTIVLPKERKEMITNLVLQYYILLRRLFDYNPGKKVIPQNSSDLTRHHTLENKW